MKSGGISYKLVAANHCARIQTKETRAAASEKKERKTKQHIFSRKFHKFVRSFFNEMFTEAKKKQQPPNHI